MRKQVILPAFGVLVLSSLFWFSNCADIGITLVGTPKPKPSATIQSIVETGCQNLKNCGLQSQAQCETEILSTAGLPASLGAPEFAKLESVGGSKEFPSYVVDQKLVEDCFIKGAAKNSCARGPSALPGELLEISGCQDVLKRSGTKLICLRLPEAPVHLGAILDNRSELKISFTSTDPRKLNHFSGSDLRGSSGYVSAPVTEIQPVQGDPAGYLVNSSGSWITYWMGAGGNPYFPTIDRAASNFINLTVDLNMDSFSDYVVMDQANSKLIVRTGTKDCLFCGSNQKYEFDMAGFAASLLYSCNENSKAQLCIYSEVQNSVRKFQLNSSGLENVGSFSTQVANLKSIAVVGNTALGLRQDGQLSSILANPKVIPGTFASMVGSGLVGVLGTDSKAYIFTQQLELNAVSFSFVVSKIFPVGSADSNALLFVENSSQPMACVYSQKR